jgi:circadian clock protein KaiC
MIEEKNPTLTEKHLDKSPIGITGFDDIIDGGLQKGHTTLVYGSAGSGKTLIAMEFLVKGAQKYDELGVFIAFGEKKSHKREFRNF